MSKKKHVWTRGGLKGRLSGVLKNLNGILNEPELLNEYELQKIKMANLHIQGVLTSWVN